MSDFIPPRAIIRQGLKLLREQSLRDPNDYARYCDIHDFVYEDLED